MAVNDSPSTKGLTTSLTKYLQPGKFSDLKVRCSDDIMYDVHKAIVCSQSRFFEQACNPAHTFKENATGVIELKNEDADAVRALLQFMYYCGYETPSETGNPGDRSSAPSSSSSSKINRANDFEFYTNWRKRKRAPATTSPSLTEMLFHAQMYGLSGFYGIDALAPYAKQRFEACVDERAGWKEARFARVVELVYATTPARNRGLRDMVVYVCRRNYRALMADPDFAAMKTRLAESFAKELDAAVARAGSRFPLDVEAYRCPAKRCDNVFYANPELVRKNYKGWDGESRVFCTFCCGELALEDLKGLQVIEKYDVVTE
ncbi:uncharacterized protein K452DRAFT_300717 [Aplosporella prunicola CBS 121167]|uniref:BTB domain-containing protein n=1 Tax=Aplosporella prunicola CBS 121167 TaxID=1176127 RepID=A0A6A6B9L2_9PEZI|nr:uncharacterized protein K452DRAFT_300717 [Aplosporella prunicola CBS 121167]KAF2139171.1 hypothetical protein K452DRAFT_300717 [Aplosporella prunicola CBS 121167]